MTTPTTPDVEQERAAFAPLPDPLIIDGHYRDHVSKVSGYTDAQMLAYARQHSAAQLAALTEKLAAAERSAERLRATLAAKQLARAFDGIGAGRKARQYTPGEWFKARTLDEMQAFFMSRLPAIRESAREHGYAIGLHGSTRRDFDLMAMQWRGDASDKDTLAHAIAVASCGITRDGAYQWESKPSGRFAVSIPICWTDHGNPDFANKPSIGHIDLSVMEPSDRTALDTMLAEARGEAVPKWIREAMECELLRRCVTSRPMQIELMKNLELETTAQLEEWMRNASANFVKAANALIALPDTPQAWREGVILGEA